MMTQKEIDKMWYAKKEVPGIRYKLNDSVKIRDGIHKDKLAVVISLLEIVPVQKYSVELGNNGQFIDEWENNLELIVD